MAKLNLLPFFCNMGATWLLVELQYGSWKSGVRQGLWHMCLWMDIINIPEDLSPKESRTNSLRVNPNSQALKSWVLNLQNFCFDPSYDAKDEGSEQSESNPINVGNCLVVRHEKATCVTQLGLQSDKLIITQNINWNDPMPKRVISGQNPTPLFLARTRIQKF